MSCVVPSDISKLVDDAVRLPVSSRTRSGLPPGLASVAEARPRRAGCGAASGPATGAIPAARGAAATSELAFDGWLTATASEGTHQHTESERQRADVSNMRARRINSPRPLVIGPPQTQAR